MIRAQSIMLLLPVTVVVYAPTCWGMEVEPPELPPQKQLLQTAITKIGKGLPSGGRISHNRIAKQFTTPLFKARAKFGAKALGAPVRVKLAVSGRPVIAPGAVSVEPIVELKASKALSHSVPGNVEMSVTSRPQNDNSLFIVYRFSF